MVEFNDLDALLYEPTEPYDISASPLLDVRNEEEARVDTFSPIDSPTKELLGDYTAPDIAVRSEKLPGSLPGAPEFPQSSPLSHLKPDSPAPSSFGLENPEFETPAPAGPQTTPMPVQLLQSNFCQNLPCDPQHRGDIDLGLVTPRQEHSSSHVLKQQPQTCQENAFSTSPPACLQSTTLHLPTDKRLTRRGRWELATAKCLQLLPESVLRKITVDVLSHMEPPILQLLASWADILDKKASPFSVAVPNSNCGPCPVSKEDVDVRTDYPNSPSVAQCSQEGDIVNSDTRQPVCTIEDPVGVESEPGPLVMSENPDAPNPLPNASGRAIKLETMLDTGTKFHKTQVEVGQSPLNIYATAMPLEDLGLSAPRRLLQPTAQPSVLSRIRKTSVKRRAPLSKKGRGGISRKVENQTKKPQKETIRNIASDNRVSSRYIQTWKQTLAQKEARENAAKSKAKRKHTSIRADPCEPNSKRVAVASDSNIKAAKPMSEAAKFIAQKHLDIRRRNMEQRRESAQNGQQGSMIHGSAPSSTPSRFCHLCTRTAKLDVVLVCNNVSRGTCRKVVCFRCVQDQSWNLQALLEDQKWTCTHCRNVSTKLVSTPKPYNA